MKYVHEINFLPKLEKFVGYQFSNTFYNKKHHKPYNQYYDQYTLGAINTIYKEDFLMFEYKKIRK